MKKLIVLSMLTLSALLNVACNTVEGLGQDIQSGGKAVERAADNNK